MYNKVHYIIAGWHQFNTTILLTYNIIKHFILFKKLEIGCYAFAVNNMSGHVIICMHSTCLHWAHS